MKEVSIKRNGAFLDQFDLEARYYYNIGGRWSGKTFEILTEIILNHLSCSNSKSAIFRKTSDSLRDTVYADAIAVCKHIGLTEGVHYTANVSPMKITFGNGSTMLFKGAADKERIKGLAGIHWVFLEECNEFEEMDFETIDQGIRGKGYDHRIYLAHNPIPTIPGSIPWFKKLFGSVHLPTGEPILHDVPGLGNVVSLKSTYNENHFCPQHVRERLEGYKITNPHLYKLWACGEYTEIEGAILKDWDVVKSVPEGIPCIGYGLDFGFANDPAALIKVWIKKKEIWIQGKIYSTGLSNMELGKKMRGAGVTDHEKIIADSAEPKSINDLFNDGFRGIKGAKKKAGYKADMALVLQGYTIHVIEGDTDLQREIATWSWDEDKNGKFLPRPRDGEDHYMDGLIMRMHEYKGSGVMSAVGV